MQRLLLFIAGLSAASTATAQAARDIVSGEPVAFEPGMPRSFTLSFSIASDPR